MHTNTEEWNYSSRSTEDEAESSSSISGNTREYRRRVDRSRDLQNEPTCFSTEVG